MVEDGEWITRASREPKNKKKDNPFDKFRHGMVMIDEDSNTSTDSRCNETYRIGKRASPDALVKKNGGSEWVERIQSPKFKGSTIETGGGREELRSRREAILKNKENSKREQIDADDDSSSQKSNDISTKRKGRLRRKREENSSDEDDNILISPLAQPTASSNHGHERTDEDRIMIDLSLASPDMKGLVPLPKNLPNEKRKRIKAEKVQDLVLVDEEEGQEEKEEEEEEEVDGIRLETERIIQVCEIISERLMKEIRRWSGLQRQVKDDCIDLTSMKEEEGEGAAAVVAAATHRINADMLAHALTNISLKPYQLVGINWLYLLHQLDLGDIPRALLPEGAFKGRWKQEALRINCVLADDMGLGKTVQTIGFLSILRELEPETYTHLIIVPASVLSNWEKEFERFAPHLQVWTYHGSAKERAELRQEYYEAAGSDHEHVVDVILATYTIWEKDTGDEDRKFLNKIPIEYMVLDEGHNIKNTSSQRYVRLRKQKARRRLVLSGTPVQNHVKELLSLLSFLNPRIMPFDEDFSIDAFWNVLVRDLRDDSNAGSSSSSSNVEELGEKGAIRKLKHIFAPFVLRRVKSDVLDQLTDKRSVLEMVVLHPEQRQAYESVTSRHLSKMQELASELMVRALTPSPLAVMEQEEADDDGGDKHNGEKQKVRTLRSTFSSSSSSSSRTSHDEDEEKNKKRLFSSVVSEKEAGNIFTEWRKAANHPLLLRRRYTESQVQEMVQILHQTGFYGWECSKDMVKKELDSLCDFELHTIVKEEKRLAHLALPPESLFDSGKCRRLRELLPRLVEEGHRVLIFSTWTRILDILGEVLDEVLKIPFLRLDGQTPVAERQQMIDEFNAPQSPISIFLLSMRAGGLGINLTSADTVILHDPDWNPSFMQQAEDRCHRIGQTKPVTVYKLVAQDTVDEKIFNRAMGKLEKTEALLENDDIEIEDAAGGTSGKRKSNGGQTKSSNKEISQIVQAELLHYVEARRHQLEEDGKVSSTYAAAPNDRRKEGEQRHAALSKTKKLIKDIVDTEEEDEVN